MLWVVVVLVTALFAEIRGAENNATSYTAAVVEYNSLGSPSTNLRQYREIIEYASTKGVDIIVFPESALNNRYDRLVSDDVYWHTVIFKTGRQSCLPLPEDKVVLCDNAQYNYKILEQMSCAARSHKMYIILDYTEHRCSSRDLPAEIVVFDREGRLIARNQKITASESSQFLGKSVSPVTFDTDFNVTFGLMSSTDVFNKELINEMLGSRRIRNFVVSSRSDVGVLKAFPYFSLSRYNQGLAYDKDVNLLVASDVKGNRLGSGIYLGKAGPAQAHHYLENPSNAIIISKVPVNSENYEFKDLRSTMHLFNDMKVEQSSVTFEEDVCSSMNAKYVITPTFRKQFRQTFCQNSFCCHFDVEYNENYTKSHESLKGDVDNGFLAIVDKGHSVISDDSYEFGMCVLIPCVRDSLTKYYFQTNEPLLKHVKINTIQVNDNYRNYVPVVGTSKSKFSYDSVPMGSERKEITMALLSPNTSFDSFGIYVASLRAKLLQKPVTIEDMLAIYEKKNKSENSVDQQALECGQLICWKFDADFVRRNHILFKVILPIVLIVNLWALIRVGKNIARARRENKIRRAKRQSSARKRNGNKNSNETTANTPKSVDTLV